MLKARKTKAVTKVQMQLFLPISEPWIAPRSSNGLCGGMDPYRFLRATPFASALLNSLPLRSQGILLLGIQGVEAAGSTFLKIGAGIYTPKEVFS